MAPNLPQTVGTLLGNTLSLFLVLLSTRVLRTIKEDSIISAALKMYLINDYRNCPGVKMNVAWDYTS